MEIIGKIGKIGKKRKKNDKYTSSLNKYKDTVISVSSL